MTPALQETTTWPLNRSAVVQVDQRNSVDPHLPRSGTDADDEGMNFAPSATPTSLDRPTAVGWPTPLLDRVNRAVGAATFPAWVQLDPKGRQARLPLAAIHQLTDLANLMTAFPNASTTPLLDRVQGRRQEAA